jgi:hypothetical protein
MYNTITNNRRRVPVPRQAIRLIAGGLKTSVIAAMLGHMLRCLYYRDRCCISGGWCKASWIAEVFHVDLRNVKAARKHLVAIGWLQMLDTPQVLSNRFGSYTIIRLSWTRASVPHKAVDTAQPPVGQSPPPPEFSTTGLPPLILHSEPLQEHQHQKPAVQADQPAPLPQHTDPASGVQGQGKHTTDKATPQAPTLWHIVPDDLRDTGRLLVLFEQAHTQGWIGKSESNRLTFVATAEHARVIGSTNPCGLFAELIRRKCWHYVTESDEDAAHRRLKAHLYGADHQTRGSPQPHDLTPPALSKDAAIVHYLQTQLARAGFAEDIFGLMSRDDASWTRERWDNAVGELDQARRIWHQGNVRNRLGDLTELGDPLGSLVATTSACAHSSAA